MTGTVLIVDDSQTVRMNLTELLNAAGLPTRSCATVAEARAALAEERFSLALLDVLLPDGDGIQLVQEIRASPAAKDTAVILLSTEAEVRDRVRGLATGADEYVGKPYDANYLVARARELVRRSDGAAGTPDQKSVLVIDDSITFREELKAALEVASYEVLVAGSGEEGLRLAAHQRPAAMIVDGILPGMDGASVIRHIRLDAALRGLPCLLLTGMDDRSAELRALDAGADAFVRKDEDISLIIAKFSAMLRSAGPQASSRRMASLQGPKRILAVDDSETHLQLLGEALRAEGYEVVLARSGEEALDLLAVQPVDCILLDLMMPGIGGGETCRRIKSAPIMRDIPVVMLTAVENREAMIQGLSSGADDYIAKSGDFDVLRARVLAQIRRKQFEDENRSIREQLLRAELESVEAQTARKIAEARASLVEELQAKNEELDAFSYSVAHDLRAPLRSLDGFSLALLEDYAPKFDEEGRQYLHFIRESAQQMSVLIDDLLELSRVTRSDFERGPVDIAHIASGVADRLQSSKPDRHVDFVIADTLEDEGDTRLLAIVLENLIGNAWKYSSKQPNARIEVGVTKANGQRTYFVRDNGAGFDMTYASKLFGVFQRLHSTREFEGTGIGLATVQRIIRRHGGRVWADGKVDHGATFYFTLSGGLQQQERGLAA